MEQYMMPKQLDFKNLRLCLDNYTPNYLYIRLVGSSGGTVQISESLEGKTLDFKKKKSGLHMLIDSEEAFHFPLKAYNKGFTLMYTRIELDESGIERQIMLPRGVEPYNPILPEPIESQLRIVLDKHLLEITFDGRIDIKFHSWLSKPHWRYWMVDKPLSISENKSK